MKINKSKIVEFFIFSLSVYGSFLVASLNTDNQFNGFCFWVVGNGLAIGFFIYHKMYMMMLQFFIYLIIAIKAIVVRL